MPRAPIAIAGWFALGLVCLGCAGRAEPMGTGGPAFGARLAPAGPAAEPAVQLTDASGLDDYLAAAAMNSPRMQAAFHRWQAAAAQTAQAKALPHPRLTYRYYIEQVETRVGAQIQSVQLAQTFPAPGAIGARTEAAAKAAEASRLRYEAVKLGVFYDVTAAYHEYDYLHRAIELTGENLQLVQSIESIAASRYRTDSAKHADVIRAQVELGKLDDRLRTLKALRAPLAARLNAAMNRPADAPLPAPRAAGDEPIAVNAPQCRRWVAEGNPQLRALDSEIAGRRAQVDVARKSYLPDLTVGLQWIDTADAIGPMRPSDSGTDPIIAMVSVNVPLWRDKLDASLRQARRRHAAATAERAQTANDLDAQVAMVLYQLGDAERKMKLYRDTLTPKAAESVSVIESGYRTGKAGFIDLLDAVQVVLEFQLAFERARADRASHVARLEMLIGRELPAATNATPAPVVLDNSD